MFVDLGWRHGWSRLGVALAGEAGSGGDSEFMYCHLRTGGQDGGFMFVGQRSLEIFKRTSQRTYIFPEYHLILPFLSHAALHNALASIRRLRGLASS